MKIDVGVIKCKNIWKLIDMINPELSYILEGQDT